MSGSDQHPARASLGDSARPLCPPWCVTRHGVNTGEEDWIHAGEPRVVSEGVVAQLCMSVEPDTGVVNGPYVVIGASEFTLAEAESLGASLIAMARLGTLIPEADGTRSPGHER